LADRVAALEEKRGRAACVTISIDGVSREDASQQMVRRPGESDKTFKERVRAVRNAPIWISIR
jgi:hypothetical protein